jgi:hypothetical protein
MSERLDPTNGDDETTPFRERQDPQQRETASASTWTSRSDEGLPSVDQLSGGRHGTTRDHIGQVHPVGHSERYERADGDVRRAAFDSGQGYGMDVSPLGGLLERPLPLQAELPEPRSDATRHPRPKRCTTPRPSAAARATSSS